MRTCLVLHRTSGPSTHRVLVAATPDVFHDETQRARPKRPQELRETAIDIMYENERGCFMCGAALFSSKALGGLDPSAWSE